MKKLFHLLVVAFIAATLSAFTPQKANMDTFYYEDENGTVQSYEGVPCTPQTTSCCKINLQGQIFRIYFDFTLTLPVPGPNCN